MKNFKHNYYSEKLKEKLSNILKCDTSMNEIEDVFKLFFIESNEKMKSISPKYRTYFPTNKYNRGWKYGSIIGLINILSGGISLKRTIEWESSMIKTNEKNHVINDSSSAFIIDLNGDIYNMIDLTKMIEDRNGYDGVLSIKLINAGLLKQDNKGDFVWHGGNRNKWKMKYPYKQLKPVQINDDNFYQPFSREQIFSVILINKIFKENFPLINPIIGNTFFTKMLNSMSFIESLNKVDNDDFLASFPSFL